MYTLLKSYDIYTTLMDKGVTILTRQDFMRLFSLSQTQAKHILQRENHGNGALKRVRQNLYMRRNTPPSEEEIANKLYAPSYISLEYALAYHSVIPEMPYAITSVTTKATRIFTLSQKVFSYSTIKLSAFSGYTPIKRNTRTFFIADPEKAFVDYLYFVTLKKKSPLDRIDISKLQIHKIQSYVTLFSHPGLKKLINTYI